MIGYQEVHCTWILYFSFAGFSLSEWKDSLYIVQTSDRQQIFLGTFDLNRFHKSISVLNESLSAIDLRHFTFFSDRHEVIHVSTSGTCAYNGTSRAQINSIYVRRCTVRSIKDCSNISGVLINCVVARRSQEAIAVLLYLQEILLW